jgi:putative ABC transport system ATP-binding protein
MLELEDVTKVYSTGAIEVRALDGVSLRIDEGEMVAIMGHSGSGKSTMMNIIGCLDVPTSGSYRLDGTDVTRLSDNKLAAIRNRKIGFVFQSFNLLPRTSAQRNVELPLVYAGEGNRAARARAALDQVGLAARAGHMPNELSGGQQQRVAIARALVTNPAMILADEPTGALDSVSTDDVMHLLVELNEAGRTVVIITHEADVAQFAGRVVTLSDGRIVSDATQQRSAGQQRDAVR